MKKYLLIFGIISVLLISACSQQTEPVLPAPQPSVIESAEEAAKPSISVDNQEVANDNVVIKSLFLDKSGYVEIHKVEDGKAGLVIGNSRLLNGENINVKIKVSGYENENELIAMLHYDDGDEVHEFPGDDKPTTTDGKVVLQKFALVGTAPSQGPVQIEAPAETEEEPQQEDLPAIKEFTIKADDKELSPSSIEVNNGDHVKITFNVREEETYFGGLDFRSDVWGDTGKVAPGDTKTVEFIADKTFQYKSYWPASNRLKATGTVNVK